jgi:hypothetical protein
MARCVTLRGQSRDYHVPCLIERFVEEGATGTEQRFGVSQIPSHRGILAQRLL